MDSVALTVATVHLAICPFTKVEESFNLQAMHDIFYHNTNISAYDHLEFPGVVPRTFLGSIFVCLLSSPFYFLLEHFQVSKFSVQLLVRCVLGTAVIFSWSKYKSTVEYLFGEGVARWLLILTVSQFHFMFYLSRTLPNIMALPFVLFALHAWLRKQHSALIWMSGICVVIFRAELVLFLGLLILFELFYLRLSITGLLVRGIPIGLCCLALTVGVDSFFWQRLLWPEGDVLYFNTILNGSVDYGTHPFFWYFYSALPRAMGASIFLLPSSLVWDKRIRRLVCPALLFILLYSCLPHKELRFIIYTFPVLNTAAAYTCNLLWTRRAKSFLHKCVALSVLLHVLINFTITYFLLSISSNNYPGGMAISTLHKIEPPDWPVNVHIDNFAAQTGVSRFTQLNPTWTYNKTEYLKPGSPELMSFTHLIVEAKSKYSPNLKPYVKTHNIISIIETFSHLQFNYLNFVTNVVNIKTKPILYILKRKDLIREQGRRPETPPRSERDTARSESPTSRDSSERVVVKEETSDGRNISDDEDQEDDFFKEDKPEDIGVKETKIAKDDKKEKLGNKDKKEGKSDKVAPKEDQISQENKKDKIAEQEKLLEESVRESIKERLRAGIKESLQQANEKRRSKAEREDIQEKVILPINMDETSKGEFVGAKYEGEMCTNCNEKKSEDIEVVKRGGEAGNGKMSYQGEPKVNSIREDIKKKIIRFKLKEKMESRNNKVEDNNNNAAERESSDEYINIEDE
uniref:Mannosyltransferase n=1 Tax=Cacopsylla melanoneura TaxID=428564 RepID=A0A8D9C083_9HEMI